MMTIACLYCASLNKIAIPETTTSIGDNAFSGCDSLQYNEYDNGLYLGNDKNPYLVLINAKDKAITEMTMPDDTILMIYSYQMHICQFLLHFLE